MSKALAIVLVVALTVGYSAYLLVLIATAGKLGDIIVEEVKVMDCRADCRLHKYRKLDLPPKCAGYCK